MAEAWPWCGGAAAPGRAGGMAGGRWGSRGEMNYVTTFAHRARSLAIPGSIRVTYPSTYLDSALPRYGIV